MVDPPRLNTAAWVRQSAWPSDPSAGTSYIYGHACHKQPDCPFTDLKSAKLGDPVIVTTRDATLTYTIRRIGLSSMSARSLPAWASDSTIKDRVVLVTCKLEPNSPGRDNIVVLAELTPSHLRSPASGTSRG